MLGQNSIMADFSPSTAVHQAVRNPAKSIPRVETVDFDYAGPSTISPALEGMAPVVLIATPLEANVQALLGTVVAAAKLAGVRHIVLISVFGVNPNGQAPLRIVEHLVIDSGVTYTIVRPNFFMENFSDGFLATNIREQNAICVAASTPHVWHLSYGPAPIHGPHSHPIRRDDYRSEHPSWNSVQQIRAASERLPECRDCSRNRHRACAALWRAFQLHQRTAQAWSSGK
jgi:uncharacterized protein YbjT (DUF2867 family)